MASQMAQRSAHRTLRASTGSEHLGGQHGLCLRHAVRRHRNLRPGRCHGVIRADSVVGTRMLRKGTLKLKQPAQEEEPKPGTQFFFTGTQGSLFSGGKKAQNTSLVFVAGATGRLGARIVRELLQAGYQVRAGVRDVDAARQYAAVAVKYELLTAEQEKRLTLVPFDLEKPETIKAAIGQAVKVVCAVGASESDLLNSTGPQRVDGEGSVRLVELAEEAGVEQFVLVTSLGTAKFGWPASALNLFWGVLAWKRKAEEALERSGMTYTIVRPGGMERPKDNYKETHKMVLGPRDTYFGGQVSRLQVAELVAAVIGNAPLAENKVLEVIAETTAPDQRFEDLLVAIPSDITKEEQAQLREAQNAAQGKLKVAQSKLDSALAGVKAAEEKLKEAEAKLKQVKAEEAGARKEVAPVLAAGAKAEAALAAAKDKVAKTAKVEAAVKAVLEATKKAGMQGELLSDKDRQAIYQNAINPPPPPAKPAPAEKRSIFGSARQQTKMPVAAPAAAQGKQAVSQKQEPAPQVVSTPPLFAGLFGAPKPAPAAQEPEPAVEEARAKPAGLFGSLFVPKAAAPSVAERKVEPDKAPATKPLNAAQLARQTAKEKAEAAAKARAEAAGKAKADAEAKNAAAEAKKAAEAKARAEAAAKVKADAEAKKAAEMQARAETKAKAEAEAMAKAEAEATAKAKAEAEAKAKAQAEAKKASDAKAKAEAEAKAMAEADALKRKEEEARLMKEAEAKAKAAAEQRAAEEAAALAAIEEERRKAAEAKAKAKAEEEAKAIAEAKAKEAAKVAAAKAAQPSSLYNASDAAERKKSAQAWISKWAEKQSVASSNGVVKEPATLNKKA